MLVSTFVNRFFWRFRVQTSLVFKVVDRKELVLSCLSIEASKSFGMDVKSRVPLSVEEAVDVDNGDTVSVGLATC